MDVNTLLIPEDRDLIRGLLRPNNSKRLLGQFIQANKDKLAEHQESNNIFIQFTISQENQQQFVNISKADLLQEIRSLQIRKEQLERQNVDQNDLIKQNTIQISDQKDKIESQQQLIIQMQERFIEQNKIIENNNISADAQYQAIKDLKATIETITKELQQVSIERNQLQEMMLMEKVKISDQLNEMNELNESLQRQKRALEADIQRFNQQYKDMQSGGKFISLAPQATEAQLSRVVSDDIPQMVVRRLNKYHGVEIYDIAQNLNGSAIVTCGGDRIVRLYDPLNLNLISQMNTSSDEVYTTIDFSPSFDSILVGSTDHSCQIFQLQNWKLRTRMIGHCDQVTSACYLGGDKDSCVSGSKDRQIKLWNIQTGACTRTIQSGSQVQTIVSQHNVPLIISGHRDGSLRGYSLKNDPKPIFHEKNLFEDTITSIAISSDNNLLLCCSKEGYYIKSYDLRMNKVMRTYQNDKYMNSYDHNKICFGPDERFIVAGNSDGSLISWTIEGKLHKILTKGQHEGVVLCVSYHPVSGQMYSADSRGNLVIWK